MEPIKIVLPEDGHSANNNSGEKELLVQPGISGQEIMKMLPKKLRKRAVGFKVNGNVQDIHTPPQEEGSTVELILDDTDEALHILRHSTAHVMADAVLRLFPGTKLAIGPAIEAGFYYDFDTEKPFSEDDLEKIEDKMREIIRENLPFQREQISHNEAIKRFKKDDDIYKLELAEALPEDSIITLYHHGDFTDLCRGPHVAATGKLPFFKLLSVAGAYWRGDEHNQMLQRIYGTAFFDKKSLKAHLRALEEARQRDHRKLARELDLFSINQEVGPGLILWHPRGASLRESIETFCKRAHRRVGYELIVTPHLGRANLWQTSGHLDFYSENMYSPMDIEGQDYYVKPMNCPFHIHIYKSHLRSYRDLPMKVAEWGTVYRYERSGVLHGLMRVRGFTQDDAHIYCTPAQMEEEIVKVIDFTLYILRSFGFDKYHVYLSTRPEKFVGEPERWVAAQESLKRALTARGLEFDTDEGGGAFYGPKIDIKIKDALGREWQCSTIQFDFSIPERFDVSYIGEDGHAHRPYMIHRALLGSMERFIGCLIEHYKGAFPPWMAPEQFRVMTITDEQRDYALTIRNRLKADDYRVTADLRNEKIGFKIREAQLMKVPYMLIIGQEELEAGSVTVRLRDGTNLRGIKLDDFLNERAEELGLPNMEELPFG